MWTPLQPRRANVPTQVVENADTTKLFKHFQTLANQPNIITRTYFEQFEPLFRKNHNLSDQQITNLTALYTKTIDLYKETQIIESNANHTVVLTLPALFTPVRTLSTTEQNEEIVSANLKLSGSDVPRYGSDAFNRMMHAIRREQDANKAVVAEAHRRYVTTVRDFFAKYRGEKTTVAAVTAVAEVPPSKSPVPENTDWDFE